jgi:malonyl-CoA O-methyltransferase
MKTDTNPASLRRKDVKRRFDRAAASIDAADFVHRQTADGLFERMTPMQIEVSVAVDLGCATGRCSRDLAKRFRRARIVSLDLSSAMLKKSRSKRSRFSKLVEVQADLSRLPFADQSVDLVFANMLLPWVDDLPNCFSEVSRVLRKDGLFSFSSLGPASLAELRDAWRDVDDYQHVNIFPDMHVIGDSLVQAGLRDPVLDVDFLTVQYKKLESLFGDLTACGARNSLLLRPGGLTGRAKFAAVRDHLEALMHENGLHLPLELVFGHAWGGGPRQSAAEYHLGVEQIGRRRHQGSAR